MTVLFRPNCLFLLFSFIYMGFDIAMEEHSWSHIGFIFFSIVSFSFTSKFHKLGPFDYLLLVRFLDLTTDIHNCCKVLTKFLDTSQQKPHFV